MLFVKFQKKVSKNGVLISVCGNSLKDGISILKIIILILILFSNLIFCEFIICNFCGLNQNTEKNITERGNNETNQISLIQNNDDSEIKYFSCRCQINKKSDISYKYFDSTILIYENQLYVGNSSSNPNYTRIVDKYQLSNCSLKYSENIKNCINLFFPEDKNNYIIVELVFSDSELLYQKMQIIKEGIDKSIINEKKKFEDYLNNLK